MIRKVFLLFIAVILIFGQSLHTYASLPVSNVSTADNINAYMNFVKYYEGSPEDLINVCNESKKVLQSDPQLIKLSGPVNIIGDIHGNIDAVEYCYNTFFESLSKGYSILFLGDYVDRGFYNIKSIAFILKLKSLFPEKVFLLRGNHEFIDVNGQLGNTLYQECMSTYGGEVGRKLFFEFNKTFNYLSLAAVIDNKIFCVHGGIGPGATLGEISLLPKPTHLISSTENKLIEGLVWNDPNQDIEDFEPNIKRGGSSQYFGTHALSRFFKISNISTMIRGHQFLQYGFSLSFEFSLITLFSSPNYQGTFRNLGAIADYSKDGVIEIKNFSFPEKVWQKTKDYCDIKSLPANTK